MQNVELYFFIIIFKDNQYKAHNNNQAGTDNQGRIAGQAGMNKPGNIAHNSQNHHQHGDVSGLARGECLVKLRYKNKRSEHGSDPGKYLFSEHSNLIIY